MQLTTQMESSVDTDLELSHIDLAIALSLQQADEETLAATRLDYVIARQNYDFGNSQSFGNSFVSDNHSDHHDKDIDLAIAMSLQEADIESHAAAELDYAIALSLKEEDLIQEGFWMCRFCSFYSPSSLPCCVMCESDKSYSNESPSSSSSSSSSSQTSSKEIQTTKISNSKQICALPGCQLTATYYEYCTIDHSRRARKRNLLPPAEPGIHSVLIGNTGEFTAHLLTKAYPDHSKIKSLFLDNWLKRDLGNPHVMRIYKIQNPPNIEIAFQHMEEALGNSQLRFHGTSQHPDCMFGSNPSIAPCDRGTDQCRVCSICRSSFSTKFAGQTGGTVMSLRYGSGVYFSATSSKSHDYNNLSERILRTGDHRKRCWAWRSMFLCKVVIGKSYQTYEGNLPSNQCPPTGYDSVEGLVGAALNYDEVVVYDTNQVIPAYLIVYTLPPT